MTTLLHRHFVALSIGTAFLFVLTSLFAWTGHRAAWTSATLQQATSNISSIALMKMIGFEVPAFTSTIDSAEEKVNTTLTSFLFQLATGIYPGDLRSLLGRELPGLLTYDDARILVKGQNLELSDLYFESSAPHDVAAGEAPVGEEAEEEEEIPPTPTPKPTGEETTKRQVYIYHSHNRESWANVTSTRGIEHPTKNITLVGKQFAEELNERGVKSSVNTEDIYQKLLDRKRTYAFSYAESLRAVRTAMKQNKNLHYFFDLHRDADKPREKTTVKIKGKTYASILFVIGTANKNYEQNQKFASDLHKLLEKKYPGLSLGVIAKARDRGNNGEYNQSISPGSLLIEIGGTNNTLQECYLTVDALADVFSEYYMQAERASAEQKKNAEKR